MPFYDERQRNQMGCQSSSNSSSHYLLIGMQHQLTSSVRKQRSEDSIFPWKVYQKQSDLRKWQPQRLTDGEENCLSKSPQILLQEFKCTCCYSKHQTQAGCEQP